MPSENKTPNYGLNQWKGNEYVKRKDFVEDNLKIDTELKKVEQKIVSQGVDFEYQIPSVAGTQIRLQKQSDTNRLFFKLDADLTGAITISLDNGITEKPLKDIEGVQLTSLDKGFVEVVAYANFFILRNRGISAADLQALIEITNNAEINEHVIKTNIINALNDKTGSELVPNSSWIDIQNAISGMSNKKWASGTTSPMSFRCVTRGLQFKPSVVIIAYSHTVFAIYVIKELASKNADIMVSSSSQSGGVFGVFGGTVCPAPIIYDDGFDIYIKLSDFINLNWIAFE